MTIHHLPQSHQQLVQGEVAMPHAPVVVLAHGQRFIPQHYLRYQHTALSIQQLVSDIDYAHNTPIFAAEDAQGMYIQVGLVGRENYDRHHHVRPQKLVYGRKWRINSDTPTSEIVQTVFLAIKKAREHEVRELLTLVDEQTAKTSTPFSNHHDLSLLAHHRDSVIQASTAPQLLDEERISSYLQNVRFGERDIEILGVEQRRNGSYLVDLALGQLPLARQVEGDMAEYEGATFTLILTKTTRAALLYALMDALIVHSDLHVENHFSYQGYLRFSHNNDPAQIAALSITSRPYARDARNHLFSAGFRHANYEIDASRVPHIGTGKLAQKNSLVIDSFTDLQGHLPMGYLSEQRQYS